MTSRWLPIWQDLWETAAAHGARQGRTPAACLWGEAGCRALLWHRVAHWLWQNDLRGLARGLAHRARMRTGVEIHPAARVGRRCLLLGSGIVVGELAMLGDDCVLHAGVVLTSGGLTPLELARSDAALLPGRGHPSIGNRVRLEAGVLVAGDVFVGNDAVLQVGAVVTRDVPDAAVALGPPCRLMPQADLHADPEVRAIRDMANRLLALEEQVQVLAFQLKRQGGPSWEPRNAATYGPITAVDRLVDSSGLP